MDLSIKAIFIVTSLHLVAATTLNLLGSSPVAKGKEFQLTCDLRNSKNTTAVRWQMNHSSVGNILIQSCSFFGVGDNYTYTCSQDRQEVYLTIPPSEMTIAIQDTEWQCVDSLDPCLTSNVYRLIIPVPVVSVSIASIPNNADPVRMIDGYAQTMKCIPNANATPAPTCSWYKGSTPLGITTLQTNISVWKLENVTEIKCVCQNNATLSPITGRKSIMLLYSPELNMIPNQHVIEGQRLTVACNIKDSQPAVNRYTWRYKGKQILSYQNLDIMNISRIYAGIYTCSSFNNMTPTNGRIVTGNSSENLTVTVLYAPLILSQQNISIPEGGNLSVSCVVKSGYPLPNGDQCRWIKENNDSFSQSGKVLGIHSTRREDTGTFACTCVNTMVQTNGSALQGSDTKRFSLDVLYPPRGVPSFSPSSPSWNESTFASLTCSLNNDGNPRAVWTWSCTGRSIQSSEVNNTIPGNSILTIRVERVDHKRICTCTAVSDLFLYNVSASEKFVVKYSPEMVLLTKPNIAHENDNITLKTFVDGNPAPELVWMNADNKTIIMRDNSTSAERQLHLINVNCLDTATYIVRADNGYGNSKIKNFNLSVVCKPRLDERVTPIKKIAVGGDRKFNISLHYIGNPVPNVIWYFENNSTRQELQNGTTVFITYIATGKVEHKTQLSRTNIKVSDFGNYVAVLLNSEGQRVIGFSVVSEGPPDPPVLFSVDCTVPEVVSITWTSAFNGGSEQVFHILAEKMYNRNKTTLVGPISDKGEGRNISHSFQLEGGLWIFKVKASNAFGIVLPIDDDFCYVEEIESEDGTTSHSSGFGAGSFFGGFASAAALSAIIFIAIFIIRRKSNGNRATSNTIYESALEGTTECHTYSEIHLKADDVSKGSNVYMNTALQE